MPQKPTMPTPHMTTVDANKEVTLSCLINNRDTIVNYEFNIEELKNNNVQDLMTFTLPKYYKGTIKSETYRLSKTSNYYAPICTVELYTDSPGSHINENEKITAVLKEDFLTEKGEVCSYEANKKVYDKFKVGEILYDGRDVRNQITTLVIDGGMRYSRQWNDDNYYVVPSEYFAGMSFELVYVRTEEPIIIVGAYYNSFTKKIIAPSENTKFNGSCWSNNDCLETLIVKSSSQLPKAVWNSSDDYGFAYGTYYCFKTNAKNIIVVDAVDDWNVHLFYVDSYDVDPIATETFTFLNGVKTISGCFHNAQPKPYESFDSEIKTVNGLEKLTNIGEKTFGYYPPCNKTDPRRLGFCPKLKTFFRCNNSIETIGEHAFACSGLTEAIFSRTLKTVEAYAFAGCEDLKTIVLEGMANDFSDNTTISIDATAFKECSDIKLYYQEVTILVDAVRHALSSCGVTYTEHNMYELEGYTQPPIIGGQGSESILSFTPTSGTILNDREYGWSVTLTDGYGKTITSNPYYFRTATTPVVEIERFKTSESIEYVVQDVDSAITIDRPIYRDMPISVSSIISGESENKTFNTVYSDNDVLYHAMNATEVVSEDVEGNKYFSLDYEPVNVSFDTDGETLSVLLSMTDGDIVTDTVVSVTGRYVKSDSNTLFYPDSSDVYYDSLSVDTEYEVQYTALFPIGTYSVSYWCDNGVQSFTNTFTAKYEMSDITCNTIPIKRHRWKLYLKNSEYDSVLISDSGDIWSTSLKYTYTGFIPGRQYVLGVEVENDEGMKAVDTYEFEYKDVAVEMLIKPQFYLDYDKNAVVVDCRDCDADSTYRVMRQNTIDGRIMFIGEVPGGFSIKDYTAAALTPYRYIICCVTQTVDKAGKTTDLISVCEEYATPEWENVSVICFKGSYANKELYVIDEKDVWSFSLNVDLGDFTQTTNSKEFSSMGNRYGRIAKGDADYLKFQMSCLLGNANNVQYTGDNIETLNNLRAFASSDKTKLVVDTKGHVLLCENDSFKYSYKREHLEQPTTITLSLVEIADSDGVSIIEIGG